MKKERIEKIIKHGSTKQKIILYFSDIATSNINNEDIKVSETKSGFTVERERPLLTDRERDLIYNSVKEPRDIKYYNELHAWNQAFLLFKPSINTYILNFRYLSSQLSKYSVVKLLHKGYEDSINDILEVIEEEELRETLVKTALKSLKKFDAKRYQEEGYLPFIKIPEANLIGKVGILVEVLNEEINIAKEYIYTLYTFLDKNLPLKPYKQYIKEAEDSIKEYIDDCIKLIDAFTLWRTEETPLDKSYQVSTDERMTNKEFVITRWEDAEIEVKDEDIEDIKNAGLGI